MGRIGPWVLSLLGSKGQPSSPGSGPPETLMPPQGKGPGAAGQERGLQPEAPGPGSERRTGQRASGPANEQAGPARCAPGQGEGVSGRNPPVLAFETPAGLTLQNSANAKGAQLSARQAWTNGGRRWGLSQ